MEKVAQVPLNVKPSHVLEFSSDDGDSDDDEFFLGSDKSKEDQNSLQSALMKIQSNKVRGI
jgi:hypothetical protein